MNVQRTPSRENNAFCSMNSRNLLIAQLLYVSGLLIDGLNLQENWWKVYGDDQNACSLRWRFSLASS